MRHTGWTAAVAAVSLAVSCAAAIPGAAATPVRAGTAVRVTGTVALDTYPGTVSDPLVSCASAGNCAAVGGYVDRGGDLGGLVVGERAGAWGKARPVPGLVALEEDEEPVGTDDQATGPYLTGVSCTGAGYCALAGYSTDLNVPLLDETHDGAWGTVREVPGVTALLPGGGLIDAMVSCPRLTGQCVVAGGVFSSYPAGRPSLYFSSGRDGAWSAAQLLPVPPDSAAVGNPVASSPFYAVTAISCAPSGGCLAAGTAADSSGMGHWPFVVSLPGGTPGAPVRIPGLDALDKGRSSTITSISCPRDGYCVVGGTFRDATGRDQAFVASQRDGHWGNAEPVPGLAALNTGGGREFRAWGATLAQLACGRPGDCAAGGWYLDVRDSAYTQAWVAAEVNGRWRKAIPVPGAPQRRADGTARVNAGPDCGSPLSCALGDSAVNGVSCTTARGCAAGGFFTTGGPGNWTSTAFTITEHGGTWSRATQLPGLKALNVGRSAGVAALSCAPAGGCGVIGDYAATRSRLGDKYSLFVVTGSIG